MRKAEVEKKDFKQRPILFVVVILDEENLQFLQSLHAIRQFQQSNQPKIIESPLFSQDEGQNHQQIKTVYGKFMLHVLFAYLIDVLQLSTQTKLNCDEIEHDLQCEQQST